MGSSTTKDMKPGDIEDLKKCTNFGGKEIQAFYKNFCSEYKSQHMKTNDFKRLYKKMFPKGDSDKFAEYIFKNHDVDSNGEVDFREFLCVLSVGKHGTLEEKLNWSFRLYDMDDDGNITHDEAMEVITALLKVRSSKDSKMDPRTLVSSLFQQLDKNKDGLLSRQEFVDGAKADQNIANFLLVV